MASFKYRVAVLDDYQGIARRYGDFSSLPSDVDVEVFQDHVTDQEALVRRLHPFQIVCLMRERTKCPRSLLAQLSNLKLLITTGPRNASVDEEAIRELGIKYAATRSDKPEHLVRSTTEVSWALLLACAKNLPVELNNVRDGQWQTTVGKDLLGSTLGLFGLGNIGRSMVPIAKAFGMRVLAYSQNLTEEDARKAGVLRVDSLVELAKQSDFLSIHQRASPRSIGAIDQKVLEALGPNGCLINTSRGPIVQEDALIEALRSGRLGSAGLDVFDVEPLATDHPLRELPNVIASPHIGYGTNANYSAFFQSIVENIRAFANDETVLNQLV